MFILLMIWRGKINISLFYRLSLLTLSLAVVFLSHPEGMIPIASQMDAVSILGLVRLFPIHMDWMGLEKIEKRFDLFGIQTHPIPLDPHGLRANRTSPYSFFFHQQRRGLISWEVGLASP
jgi:hypothetical protein